MSFIYPRKIQWVRSTVPIELGSPVMGDAYSGDNPAQSTVLKSGIPCSIQQRNSSGMPTAGLPTDVNRTTWRVLTPRNALADGDVQPGDKFLDDLGRSFTVVGPYSNSLGGNYLVDLDTL